MKIQKTSSDVIASSNVNISDDHTRVRFRTIKGSVRDEYLNGNFVDGFRRENAFIATQGPLQATFPSFWKMIWEQKSVVIVMITNLFENGKVHDFRISTLLIPTSPSLSFQPKCDLYWPDSGTERFGDFEVTNVREDVLAFYTLRTFRLKHSNSSKKSDASPERTVYQYHFTSWPDHGVPSHCLPFVTFVRNSMAANPEDAGPVVVHCRFGRWVNTRCPLLTHFDVPPLINRSTLYLKPLLDRDMLKQLW